MYGFVHVHRLVRAYLVHACYQFRTCYDGKVIVVMA